MKNQKRMNQGYEIIQSTQVSENKEIVLGYNPKSKFFVCWVCFNKTNYNWGDYSEDPNDVTETYFKRILDK